MRIIITGCTYSHMHGHMYFTKSPTVSKHVFDGLAMLGHNVSFHDIKTFTKNVQELSPDLVMFGLSPSGSMSARYLHSEWESIAFCRRNNIKWCWFIDDWQFYQIASHCKSMLNNYERRVTLASKKNIRWGPLDWKLGMEDDVRSILSDFLNGVSAPIFMVYFRPGLGVPELTVKQMCGNIVFPIDPSSVFPKVEVSDNDTERERKWVLAALGNYSNWLSKQGPFNWPITLFGPTRGEKDHILENTIIRDFYSKSWGMLVPSYPVKVGRLWRSRYVHGYIADAITFTSDSDIHGVFGDSYAVSRSQVEALSLGGLYRLRNTQSQQFYAAIESENVYATRLKHAVEYIMGAP